MAIGNPYKFNGKLGKAVGYQLNGKQVIRSLPAKYTQTRATKRSATLFGKASRMGAVIRNKLLDLMPFPSDNKMQTRLSTTILQWLKENEGLTPESLSHISLLEGFQFNLAGLGLSDRWKVMPQVGNPTKGILEIKIPSFTPSLSTSAPSGTSSMILDFGAVGFSLKSGQPVSDDMQRIQVDYNDKDIPDSSVSLNIPETTKTILVTLLSIKYMMPGNLGLKQADDPKFKPCAILSAIYM